MPSFQFAVCGWAAWMLLLTTLPIITNVSGYQVVPSTTVIQNRGGAPLFTNSLNSQRPIPTISFANVAAKNNVVDISFTDGSTYRFHSLWLRDACRDAAHVATHAGEKILTPVTHRHTGRSVGDMSNIHFGTYGTCE
jgi:hypothetical protein